MKIGKLEKEIQCVRKYRHDIIIILAPVECVQLVIISRWFRSNSEQILRKRWKKCQWNSIIVWQCRRGYYCRQERGSTLIQIRIWTNKHPHERISYISFRVWKIHRQRTVCEMIKKKNYNDRHCICRGKINKYLTGNWCCFIILNRMHAGKKTDSKILKLDHWYWVYGNVTQQQVLSQ